MNNGIKKKLEELIGEEVTVHFRQYGILIQYPSSGDSDHLNKKVLRIEDDCVVIGDEVEERIISIDHISHITTRIKEEKG